MNIHTLELDANQGLNIASTESDKQ